MPKTPSDKLFKLIKSLSGSEKRYFKVHVGSKEGKDSKYLQLFDAIEAQTDFDDEALKQAVYAGGRIQSRKYSELKAYLYELILKSLQGYDEKSSVRYKLKHLLLSVRVLFRRSLFSDCGEVLAKARKLAEQYEVFTALLEVLTWEKQLAYTQGNIDFLDAELDRIAKEEQDALRKLEAVAAYRTLFLRLLVSLRKDASLIGKDYRERLGAVVDSPLLKAGVIADSHQAQLLYYRTRSIYHLALSELPEFYELSKALISLMEAQPHFLKEDVSEYISALSNLIMSCGRLGKYKELERYLDKLGKVHPLSMDDELKIHRQYYQNKFSLCIAKGDFEEGKRALSAHLKERERFDPSLFETHTFYYNYFYIAFGAQDYDEALTFLNKWLDLDHTIERQDLQGIARILNLIVHFELGNFVLLDSLLRSTYRYLRKHEQLHEVERQIITFIRKAIDSPSKRALKAAYEQLKLTFQDESKDAVTKSFFTKAFDIMAWLESKTEDRPFAAVLQERFLRANDY